MNVAPLKPEERRVTLDLTAASPRSNERGPIEAYKFGGAFWEQGISPRSNERGPIEAITLGEYVAADGSALHVRMNVAPLKPDETGAASRAAPPSPRSNERGPIEAR